MILAKITSEVFCFLGFSSTYKVLKHFDFSNKSLIQCVNSGNVTTVESSKTVIVVPTPLL